MVGIIRSEVIFATCIIYMWSPSCLRFPQHSHHGSKIVYPWTWTPWMVLGGKSHVVVSHSHQLYTTLRGREIIEISEVTKWQSVHKKCIKIQSPPRPLVCLPTAPILSTFNQKCMRHRAPSLESCAPFDVQDDQPFGQKTWGDLMSENGALSPTYGIS